MVVRITSMMAASFIRRLIVIRCYLDSYLLSKVLFYTLIRKETVLMKLFCGLVKRMSICIIVW